MSLVKRKILFFIFIFLFFVISFLVTLYAAGYKLNSKNFSLQKTGILIVETKPKGANIYIDGKIQKNFLKNIYSGKDKELTTPVKIKNLLPGEYDVKISINGYWDWKNKVVINPGISTHLSDIVLFKKDVPLLINEGEYKRIYPSPDKKRIILEGEDFLLFDIEEEKEYSLKNTKENSAVVWSPDGKRVFVEDFIYSKKGEKQINVYDYLEKGSAELKWSDSDKIFYKFNNNVKSFSLSSKQNKKEIQNGVFNDYLIKQKYSAIIEDFSGASYLNIYESNSSDLIKKIKIPQRGEYKFLHPNENLINLYDAKREVLFLINPFSDLLFEKIINNVKFSKWTDDNTLIYTNGFEIRFFDRQSGKTELLTRVSQQIGALIWYPDGNHIIYNTDEAIFIIEIKNEPKRNITQLLKLKKIKDLFIDEDENLLIFYGEIGSKKGIYKLKI